MIKSAIQIDPDEWNFSDLDQMWELRWATLYEYTRSIDGIKSELIEWLESRPTEKLYRQFPQFDQFDVRYRDLVREVYLKCSVEKGVTDLDARKLDEIARQFPQDFHGAVLPSCLIAIRFPEFPMPWMKLRKYLSIDHLEMRCCWAKSVHPIRVLRDNDLYRLTYDPSLLCETFVVNREAPAGEIIKGFRKWLKVNGVQAGSRKKRNLHFLKQLAAYRLHFALGSYWKACCILDQLPVKSPVIPDYQTQPNWLDVIKLLQNRLKSESTLMEICREFHLE